jgi:hypothetical protein
VDCGAPRWVSIESIGAVKGLAAIHRPIRELGKRFQAAGMNLVSGIIRPAPADVEGLASQCGVNISDLRRPAPYQIAIVSMLIMM